MLMMIMTLWRGPWPSTWPTQLRYGETEGGQWPSTWPIQLRYGETEGGGDNGRLHG